jgi:hypothetical protein
MGQPICNWHLLPARNDKIEGICGAAVVGESQYCAEHQQQWDYIHRLNEDWKEIEATYKAVCDEPIGCATKTHLSPKP